MAGSILVTGDLVRKENTTLQGCETTSGAGA